MKEEGLFGAFLAAWQKERTQSIVDFILIPALVLLVVLLPPMSLVDRFLTRGSTIIPHQGGAVFDPDGTQLTLMGEDMVGQARVRLASVPRADIVEGKGYNKAALQAMPQNLEIKSPLYVLSLRGPAPKAATATIPIPNEAEPYSTLDLYAWTGESWLWLPRNIILEDELIEAKMPFFPRALAVMQTRPISPTVAAEVGIGDVSFAMDSILTSLQPRGLFLASDGLGAEPTVGGEIEPLPEGASIVLPIIENSRGGVLRDDLTNNVLANRASRDKHIQEIVELVVNNEYQGITIDYRGVDPSLRTEFTDFITRLKWALGSQGKALAVRVDTPVQVAEDRWETGAYDWETLGQVADLVQLTALKDPKAYAPGGQMEALLSYAVSKVNRYKLQVVTSAYARDIVGGKEKLLTYQEALTHLSGVMTLSAAELKPGETLEVRLASSVLSLDDASSSYWFVYGDAEGEHTVWLENGQSLGRKVGLIQAFNLGGVVVDGLLEEGVDALVWDVLDAYSESAAYGVQSQFVVLWTVKDAGGNLVSDGVAPISVPTFLWTPAAEGEYSVSYALSDDGGVTISYAGGEQPILVAAAPAPTPTPTPRATGPSPTPTPKPQTGGPAMAGTGFDYGIQVHPFNQNQQQIIGWVQGLGFHWVKFQLVWAWIEPQQGQRNWGAFGFEDAINALSNAGIRIMLSVVGAPAWSRAAGDVGGPPDDYNLYADFVGEIARRYSGKVRAIEVMNETNMPREWGAPNASQYVDLLCRAYSSIKAANSSMIVISGAPTPTGGGGGAMDDRTYLTQLYQTGRFKDCADAVGVHPSGYLSPPSARWPQGDLPGQGYDDHPSFFFLNTIEDYHNTMCQFGDCNKKLWATEFGWASSDGIGPCQNWNGCPFTSANTEAEQSAWTVEAYQIGRQKGFMGVMFLWNLNYGMTDLADGKPEFGIIYPNGTLRPTYNVLAEARRNGTLP